MNIFILTTVLVSFISKCFFKKKFWENRYLILLIIGSVAFIATLTTNYATRNNYPKEVKTIWTKDLQPLNINSLLVDSFFVSVDNISLNDFKLRTDTIKNYYILHNSISFDENNLNDFKVQNYYIIYNNGEDDRIGFVYDNKIKSKILNDIFIGESKSDKAYYSKKRIYYGNRNNSWVSEISLPHIKTINCYYIPHDEYIRLKSSGIVINEIPI